MIKFVVVLVALIGVAWYGLVGGRKLDEQAVRDFYVAVSHTTMARDPEGQCKLLGKSAVVRQRIRIGGQDKSEVLDRKQACESMLSSHQFFEAAGERAGGMLTIEYEYEIGKIEISPDRKSAMVQLKSTLKMGEAFMQFDTVSTERLERHWGSVDLAESDEVTRVLYTPGALADPARFFQSR